MTEDMSSQDTTAVETAENTVETVVENADEQASNQDVPSDFEPLTATYERLRHSTDAAELSEFARRPLPDRSEQAAFSRATALLEAVAGNAHTPLEDRVFLAETMPFPNILVKLSTDESVEVRKAVAGNANDKNWLVGRLTKDESSKCAMSRCATSRRLGRCGSKARRIRVWIPRPLIFWDLWGSTSSRMLLPCLLPWYVGPLL